MQLILFRHGIALDADEGQSDFARPLSPEGIQKTQAAALGLATLVPVPDLILTSPKVRAVQTAAILGRVFKVQPEEDPRLAQDDLADLVELVVHCNADQCVMLVGHEPTMSRLIHRLLRGAAPHDAIELKKAAAAMLSLDFDESVQGVPHARLIWLLPPKVLRALT